jgi:hypothetical protein
MSEYDNGDLVNPDFRKERERQIANRGNRNPVTTIPRDRGGSTRDTTYSFPATTGPLTETEVDIDKTEENINLWIDRIIKNPNAFPGIVAFAGFGLSYYLAMHPDVFKELIRSIGNAVPDTVQAEVL